MTYDLDALRAAVEKATTGDWRLIPSWATSDVLDGIEGDEGHVANCEEDRDASAIVALVNAARSGLLDDAALGRAVRAAAEDFDSPALLAMMAAMMRLDSPTVSQRAQAAARALIAMQEGR